MFLCLMLTWLSLVRRESKTGILATTSLTFSSLSTTQMLLLALACLENVSSVPKWKSWQLVSFHSSSANANLSKQTSSILQSAFKSTTDSILQRYIYRENQVNFWTLQYIEIQVEARDMCGMRSRQWTFLKKHFLGAAHSYHLVICCHFKAALFGNWAFPYFMLQSSAWQFWFRHKFLCWPNPDHG